jgi:hypothetical protein
MAGDAVATAADTDRETRPRRPPHRSDDVGQVGWPEDGRRTPGRHRVVRLTCRLVPQVGGLEDLTARAAAKIMNRFAQH